MALEHAILGFLSMEPHSGYDLKKRFARTVNSFWPAEQSRIYRTLEKLLERGLVTREVVVQITHPNRKVYSITDSGRQRLDDWLRDAKPGAPPRSDWLVQLFFLGLVDSEHAIKVLEGKKERVQSTLDGYPERFNLSEEYEHNEPNEVDFFEWLVLDSAIHMRLALIQWIDSTIDRIREGKHSEGREGALGRWLHADLNSMRTFSEHPFLNSGALKKESPQ